MAIYYTVDPLYSSGDTFDSNSDSNSDIMNTFNKNYRKFNPIVADVYSKLKLTHPQRHNCQYDLLTHSKETSVTRTPSHNENYRYFLPISYLETPPSHTSHSYWKPRSEYEHRAEYHHTACRSPRRTKSPIQNNYQFNSLLPKSKSFPSSTSLFIQRCSNTLMHQLNKEDSTKTKSMSLPETCGINDQLLTHRQTSKIHTLEVVTDDVIRRKEKVTQIRSSSKSPTILLWKDVEKTLSEKWEALSEKSVNGNGIEDIGGTQIEHVSDTNDAIYARMMNLKKTIVLLREQLNHEKAQLNLERIATASILSFQSSNEYDNLLSKYSDKVGPFECASRGTINADGVNQEQNNEVMCLYKAAFQHYQNLMADTERFQYMQRRQIAKNNFFAQAITYRQELDRVEQMCSDELFRVRQNLTSLRNIEKSSSEESIESTTTTSSTSSKPSTQSIDRVSTEMDIKSSSVDMLQQNYYQKKFEDPIDNLRSFTYGQSIGKYFAKVRETSLGEIDKQEYEE